MNSPLKFDDLQAANKLRAAHFRPKGSSSLSHPNGDLSNWSIGEWTNALAGEVGEACNISKKIVRGDFDSNSELGLGMLLNEIADVIIYADLICSYLNRSTAIIVANKFNEKSEEINSPIKI